MIILLLNILHTFPIVSGIFASGKPCLFNKKTFTFAYTIVGKARLLTTGEQIGFVFFCQIS